MKKIKIVFSLLLLTCTFQVCKAQYIGEIRMFAGNFPPNGWAFCNGQLLSIAENEALFAIIGTTYGGDGQTTFAVPNFTGRLATGATGQGPGLTNVQLGEHYGAETVTLNVSQMPAHNHQVACVNTAGTLNSPTNNLYAHSGTLDKEYVSGTNPNVTMNPLMVSNTLGGNQPFNTIQPVLGVNFIISLYGVFPTQN